jgi:hypothetical protein
MNNFGRICLLVVDVVLIAIITFLVVDLVVTEIFFSL